jgi:hypothetical protein
MGVSKSAQKWLLEAIHFFRTLSFFESYRELSDEELLATLNKVRGGALIRQIDFILPYAPVTADLDRILLALDKKRVWEDDTEADVCPEHAVYVRTLNEWSAISRGTFVLEDVQEHWTSDNGPVRVTLAHQGQTFRLHPRYWDDYMDIGILTEVNEIIADTGIQFAAYDTQDQTAFVVALKPHERETLEQERNWRFLGL